MDQSQILPLANLTAMLSISQHSSRLNSNSTANSDYIIDPISSPSSVNDLYVSSPNSMTTHFSSFNQTHALLNNNIASGTSNSSNPPNLSQKTHYGGNTKLFVGNLPTDTTLSELLLVFEKYGPVNEKLSVVKDKCYAFIHFFSPKDAEHAREDVNDRLFKDRYIRVQYSTSKNCTYFNKVKPGEQPSKPGYKIKPNKPISQSWPQSASNLSYYPEHQQLSSYTNQSNYRPITNKSCIQQHHSPSNRRQLNRSQTDFNLFSDYQQIMQQPSYLQDLEATKPDLFESFTNQACFLQDYNNNFALSANLSAMPSFSSNQAYLSNLYNLCSNTPFNMKPQQSSATPRSNTMFSFKY